MNMFSYKRRNTDGFRKASEALGYDEETGLNGKQKPLTRFVMYMGLSPYEQREYTNLNPVFWSMVKGSLLGMTCAVVCSFVIYVFMML